MRILFKNIKALVQVRPTDVKYVAGQEMDLLPQIAHAFLLIDDGIIKEFGKMEVCPGVEVDETVDASGKMILPSWCDSHTHLVYAGNRETEFVDKINGLSYQDIASKGGGILNSAKTLQETTEEDLYAQSKTRLEEIIALGTGAVEIKSGYGLTTDAEIKMLRVIKRLKQEYNIPIKATFLGAHAVPNAFKNNQKEYVQLVIDDMLPKIAKENLADFIDVFCEKGYFSVEETATIIKAGKKYGIQSKIHVNQFTSIGGVQVGVQHKALSVDHLEVLSPKDITALKDSTTMPVALPGCSFFLGIPYTPGRAIIDAGLPLALATDYNPGSAPSGNMNFVVSAACIKMKLTPEEAINAATINGAYAMGLESEVGSISIGKKANLFLTKPLNSIYALPYHFGTNAIEQVYLNGKKI
ncbi:imidazolonepropionase [Tamlana fucoidanivorans]|uniref:Imidazolonepropionase n=1 Tax=Allotamlana fucoidanivorans TaxID=2583814 RepID=A0A5C4SK93_9FLAO|nr:imidazolonepropionase [Tamlana fucoidanivorans]TNJ43441.1 imidazolonepropionase [Tamlana fucoidanivorans]